MTNKSIQSIDEYIAACPKDVQPILKKIRKLLKESAPKAKETISYRIPTSDLDEKHVVHFAAFKKHIGFFPTPSAIVAFKNELSQHKTSKGTVQFPLNKPVPFDLIRKIVKFRVNEIKSSPPCKQMSI